MEPGTSANGLDMLTFDSLPLKMGFYLEEEQGEESKSFYLCLHTDSHPFLPIVTFPPWNGGTL